MEKEGHHKTSSTGNSPRFFQTTKEPKKGGDQGRQKHRQEAISCGAKKEKQSETWSRPGLPPNGFTPSDEVLNPARRRRNQVGTDFSWSAGERKKRSPRVHGKHRVKAGRIGRR